MSLLRRIRLGTIRLGLAGILVSTLLPAAIVHAQAQAPPRPPLDLMTSPLPLNVVTKPGVPVTADLRVKNNGAQPEQLKVSLLKFGASGDTGQPQLEERSPQDLFLNWVHFSETTFTAQPNVWKTITMTINPPKEAAFGYYYAVLFTRANPEHPTGGRSAVEGGVASLVLLNVDAPGARREAEVVSLEATQKVYEFLPAKFTIKLHNSGNIHIAPTGTMFIRRGDTQVAALDFNTEQGNILPGTDRVFTMDWSDGFPVYKEKTANGKTTQTLQWDFSKIQKLRFGRYTADLVAVYDNGQRDVPIEAHVSFWVIPWRFLGIALLIILIILVGIWGIGRLIWRALRRQAAVPAATEPDPSSLAAAPKRSSRKKKAAPAPAPEVEPEEPEEEPEKPATRRRATAKKSTAVKKPAAAKKPAAKAKTPATKPAAAPKSAKPDAKTAKATKPKAAKAGITTRKTAKPANASKAAPKRRTTKKETGK